MVEFAIKDSKCTLVQNHLEGRGNVLKGKQTPTSVYEGEQLGMPWHKRGTKVIS